MIAEIILNLQFAHLKTNDSAIMEMRRVDAVDVRKIGISPRKDLLISLGRQVDLQTKCGRWSPRHADKDIDSAFGTKSFISIRAVNVLISEFS